eukprot:scaffold664467_cov57-Prasinocladus_malaysianus.AAC.1
MDCRLPYQQLQDCMAKHPEAFADFMSRKDEEGVEQHQKQQISDGKAGIETVPCAPSRSSVMSHDIRIHSFTRMRPDWLADYENSV